MIRYFASIFLVSTLLFAGYDDVRTDLDEEEMLELGQSTYEETCISCHGIKGETNPDIKLVVKPRKLQKSILSKEQAFKIIKFGAHEYGAHVDIMPTFKYVYDDETIASVALYITKTFNAQRDEHVSKLLKESTQLSVEDRNKMFKVGKKIFTKKCALCHGITGNGESDFVEQSKSEANFIYPYNLQKILLSEEQIFLYAKFGGHFWGTEKNDMPSWKRKFNDVKLKSVAKYIQENIKKHH